MRKSMLLVAAPLVVSAGVLLTSTASRAWGRDCTVCRSAVTKA